MEEIEALKSAQKLLEDQIQRSKTNHEKEMEKLREENNKLNTEVSSINHFGRSQKTGQIST